MRAALLGVLLACSGCNQILGIGKLHLGDEDAPVDAGICYGNTPLFTYCVDVAPTNALPLDSNIVTDTDQNCDPKVAAQCVIVAGSITVSAVNVTGTRPLVLVAAQSISVTGKLDASSTRGDQIGAGAHPTGLCPGQTVAATSANQGGGGGAGGSFATLGGSGSNGSNGAGPAGGMPGTADTSLAMIRGGCDGGLGGPDDIGDAGAAGGAGGGVLVLVAGDSIQIESTGRVFASGAAGSGGQASKGGGGGGGSGGMIGLDAMNAVMVAGTVSANGGAGGEGASGGTDGRDGEDGATDMFDTAARGGNGGTGNGGDGGDGATLTHPLENGKLAADAGGGGGGSVGLVWTHGTVSGNQISPANSAL